MESPGMQTGRETLTHPVEPRKPEFRCAFMCSTGFSQPRAQDRVNLSALSPRALSLAVAKIWVECGRRF